MMTMRSSLAMKPDSTLSSDVLPEPVPPATTMLRLPATQAFEEGLARLVDRAEREQRLDGQPLLGEAADRQADAAPRRRRQHRAHAAAVGQAGVEHRPVAVGAAADELRDVAHRRLERVRRREARLRQVQLAALLDVDLARPVDHDLGTPTRRPGGARPAPGSRGRSVRRSPRRSSALLRARQLRRRHALGRQLLRRQLQAQVGRLAAVGRERQVAAEHLARAARIRPAGRDRAARGADRAWARWAARR